MRILAGGEPYGGKVIRSGDIGYLPQDSAGNIEQTGRDRVLSPAA